MSWEDGFAGLNPELARAYGRIAELEAMLRRSGHGLAGVVNDKTRLEAERDRLRFALQVIAAGETTDPAAMARAALSDPSGENA
jgi:hypothetical protein